MGCEASGLGSPDRWSPCRDRRSSPGIESQRATQAAGLVERLLDADTPQVPDIVGAMRDYRRWVDPPLRSGSAKGAG